MLSAGEKVKNDLFHLATMTNVDRYVKDEWLRIKEKLMSVKRRKKMTLLLIFFGHFVRAWVGLQLIVERRTKI